jgi:hypothetical protein
MAKTDKPSTTTPPAWAAAPENHIEVLGDRIAENLTQFFSPQKQQPGGSTAKGSSDGKA